MNTEGESGSDEEKTQEGGCCHVIGGRTKEIKTGQ